MRKQVALAQIAWDKILGLRVGVTGVINSATGICHEAYILGWHNVRIGEALETALDIPVYVDNDTRTLTIAKQHFGMSHSCQNFVLVTVGRGVGMGAVVNGELLRGHHDIGAEFDHITDMMYDHGGVATTVLVVASAPQVFTYLNRQAQHTRLLDKLAARLDPVLG